jgi:hypothetical protein
VASKPKREDFGTPDLTQPSSSRFILAPVQVSWDPRAGIASRKSKETFWCQELLIFLH